MATKCHGAPIRTRMTFGVMSASCGLLAVMVWTSVGVGQEPREQEPREVESDTVQIYQREIFEYPSLNRRDPFLPLTAGQQLGPRFEDLQLSGVLYAPEVGSVATLTDTKTGKRYRTREGDSLGGIRVVAIRDDAVEFVITSFGVSRRETLRVSREKEQDG